MATILALDAAWTPAEPSGVALVQDGVDGWRCVALAPSYSGFFARADGEKIDWLSQTLAGEPPDVPRLLQAARSLAKEPVDLITLDMPVATIPFSSRRLADNMISSQFGSYWCSAHTPNASRPGLLGAQLSAAIRDQGYKLATTATRVGETKRLVEVYPHPALLSLLKRDRRVPYKVGKSKKYWPGLSVQNRIAALLREFNFIYIAIEQVFGPLHLILPFPEEVPSLARLKRYEDALDALICAWVGVEYLRSRVVAFGDKSAAIWCPLMPRCQE